MKKVLIDLGTHFGNGLSMLIKHFGVDKTWEIHTFEPNKFTFEKFKEIRLAVKETHPNYSWIYWNNITYHNAAAWIQDGEIDFNCATVEGSKKMIGTKDFDDYLEMCKNEISEGKSITSIHDLADPTNAASTIINPVLLDKEGHNFIQKTIEFKQKDKIKAKCVDFSSWLKRYNAEDHIVVKMDIEGAEYFVLEKLIANGIPPCLKVLNIEWHDWFLPNHTPYESKLKLAQTKHIILNSLNEAGVEIGSWV